jgi:hypothetical protein
MSNDNNPIKNSQPTTIIPPIIPIPSSSSSSLIYTIINITISLIQIIPFGPNILVLLILYIFDRLVAPNKARWFAIHGFANVLVVIFSFNGMITSLLDPLYSLDARVYNDHSTFGNSSRWPVYIINSLHIYHLLFFEVTKQELFHHLIFVPIIGFMGQWFDWGPSKNFMAFFISGLPGAIDYLLLILVKFKKVHPLTQKRVCASMNVYVRGPFIVVSAHTVYLAMLYGHSTVPSWVCAAVLVISVFNSLYNTKQSVANWAVSQFFDRAQETLAAATAGFETQVVVWKKEAESTQQKIC